jgi:hypothetical protein
MKIIPLLATASLALGSPILANAPASSANAELADPPRPNAAETVRLAIGGPIDGFVFRQAAFTGAGCSLLLFAGHGGTVIRVYKDNGEFVYLADDDTDGLLDFASGKGPGKSHLFVRRPAAGPLPSAAVTQAWQRRYDAALRAIAASMARETLARR